MNNKPTDRKIQFASADDAWDRIASKLEGLEFPQAQNTIVQLSMPKSGTHLLRNLLVGFLGGAAYDNGPWFFTHPDMQIEDRPSLQLKAHTFKTLHAGYEEFQEAIARHEQPKYRTILLVRHPAASLMSLARQVENSNLDRADFKYMSENMRFDDVLEAFACGYETPLGRGSPLAELLEFFALSWIDKADLVIRFEDLQLHVSDPRSDAAAAYFAKIASIGDFELPCDWRERVEQFSSGRLSATFASVDGNREIVGERFKTFERHAEELIFRVCPNQLSQMGYN